MDSGSWSASSEQDKSLPLFILDVLHYWLTADEVSLTDVFFYQQMEEVIFVKASVKRTVCVDGGWAVSCSTDALSFDTEKSKL